MKKIFLILIISFTAYHVSAQETDIDSLIKTLNYDNLLKEYMGKEKTADTYTLLKLCYGISVTADGKLGYGPAGNEYAEKAVTYGLKLNPDTLEEKKKTDYYYFMAKMYNRLIDGPSTWMKYGKYKDINLKNLLEKNPDHTGGNLLKAGDLLNMPENMGGNPEKGMDLLLNLEQKNPSDYEVLNQIARHYLDKDETEKAAEYFEKVIKANPEHNSAREQLHELQLMKQNRRIRTITISDGTKTDSKRILKKIEKYEGETYNQEQNRMISSSVREINSIKGIQVKGIPFSDSEIDLEIKPEENNMMMFGTIGFFQVYPDYDGDPQFNGFPAVMYMDQNFLGTGNQLMLIFAGVFLKADYTMNGIFTPRGPVVKTSVTALVLSLDENSYENGRRIDDYAVHSPKYSGEISIGKEYEIGFSAFLTGKINYHIWETDEKDVKIPSNRFTYTGSLPLSFSTIDAGNPSKLVFNDGFSICITPELIYKPGYETWGNINNPDYSFAHNSSPMQKYSTEISVYKTFYGRSNIGANIKHMTGVNYYQSERWAAGASQMIMPSEELNGYYPNEFTFNNGILANLKYSFAVLPGEWTLFAQHDVLYNINLSELTNGSALGSSFKLPYEFELTAKLGIGWNAERENSSYGYDFQASILRMWFF